MRLAVGFVILVLFLAAILIGYNARATGTAYRCRTSKYRTHVVNVLGTSEELLSAADGAYGALKLGHVTAARRALKGVHLYLPDYFDHEGRLVNVTAGCGL